MAIAHQQLKKGLAERANYAGSVLNAKTLTPGVGNLWLTRQMWLF